MYIYPGVGLRWSDRTSRSFCPPFVKGCFSSWHLDSNGGYRKTGEKTRVSVSRHLGINNKRWDHLGPLGTMEKCRFFNPRNMCYNFITSKNEGCGFSWYRWIFLKYHKEQETKDAYELNVWPDQLIQLWMLQSWSNNSGLSFSPGNTGKVSVNSLLDIQVDYAPWMR